MKYPDGKEAQLGDRVKFSNGDTGTIVFSIDTGEFSKDFHEEDWRNIKKGVMVRTDNGALVHYEDPNNEVLFFLDE